MADEATSDDLEQQLIEDAVEGVRSVTVDGLSVTKEPLKDRIEVADRAKRAQAAGANTMGLRFTRLVPPGGGGL